MAYRDTGQGRVTGPGCWAVQLLRGPGPSPLLLPPGAKVIVPTPRRRALEEGRRRPRAARCWFPSRGELKYSLKPSKPSHAVTLSNASHRKTQSSEMPKDGVCRSGWEAVSRVNGLAPRSRRAAAVALVPALLPAGRRSAPPFAFIPASGFSPGLWEEPPTPQPGPQGRSGFD